MVNRSVSGELECKWWTGVQSKPEHAMNIDRTCPYWLMQYVQQHTNFKGSDSVALLYIEPKMKLSSSTE